MATERHVTIIETDISQALTAAGRLQAATEAQTTAAKRLASVLEEGERERIAAMRASEDAAKQAAAARREAANEARAQMAAARDGAAQARREIAEQAAAEREAAAAAKRSAAERESAYRRIAAMDQRLADQREAGYRREAALIERVADERESAFARAERASEKYTAQLAKQNAAEAKGGGKSGGRLAMVAGGAAVGGAIGAGVAAGVAAADWGIEKTGELVDESFKAQSVSRNLQLDIRAARAEMGGLVSDYDLAFAANKAYAMKVVTTGDEFAHLAGMVGEQATKLGRDSGELISEAVEAIGKQESEIADNLGITMRLTDAYALYAEELDKSVSSLTAKEKAEAFNKAMIIALEQATGRATVGVEGFASAWKKAGVEYKNFRSEFAGFTDMHGRANEAMRELSDEQLDRLRFAEALNDEDAKRMDAMGATAREMQGHVSKWGLSIMDLKEHADSLNMSYLEMLDNQKAINAAKFENDKADMLAAAQQETADIMFAEVDALEQSAALLKIMGGTEREVLEAELQVLEARQMAALTQAAITKDAKDEAKAKAIAYQIEQTNAKIEMIGQKKGGKKRDPNEALDLETKAALRLLDAREKIYAAELEGERDLDAVARTRQYLITLEREELDVREQAANARTVRGAKETAEREAEQLEIMTERRLLNVEAQTLQREEGRRRAEESLAAMDREIELQAALGVATGLLERRRTEAHHAMVAQYGEAGELEQVEHEQRLANLARLDEATERERANRLAAFDREAEENAVRGDQYNDLATQRIDLELSMLNAETQHDEVRALLHRREMVRIEQQQKRRQIATQAANNLLTQGMGLFTFVAERAVKDEAKREKAMLRARGVEAVARGALETVESVAAFASFNYVQGAMHAIAAGVAFATGISMIAGKVPDKGASASATSGGGKDHQTVISQPDTGMGGGGSGAGLPATPPSAEALLAARSGSPGMTQTTASKQQGGTVININGPFIAGDAGTILRDANQQAMKKRGTA